MVEQRKIVQSNHAKHHQADKTIAYLVIKSKIYTQSFFFSFFDYFFSFLLSTKEKKKSNNKKKKEQKEKQKTLRKII